MIEEDLRHEIDLLRAKLKETQMGILKMQSNLNNLLAGLISMESSLRQVMPAHADFIKELIQDFDDSFA